MNKKIFITMLMFSILLLAFCSCSFANTNTMNNAKDSVMNAGNAIGNAAINVKDAVVDGAKDIANGAATVGNDAINGAQNIGNGARNAVDSTLNTNDSNYTATRTTARTATATNNFLGMSNAAWTWLILGIVGIAIVGLVWYYGAQYEHRDYDNN